MADFATAYLDPAYKSMKAGETLRRDTDSQFFSIFYGFTEITATLDTINLAESLVTVAPPRSRRIRKDDYLKFLIGAYLQEMYILEQRLSAYGKKMSRLYKSPGLPELIKEVVYNPLSNIIGARGSHVHNQRFTDEHLNMVSTMSLFQRVKHKMGEDLDFEYQRAQRHWKRIVSKNNQDTMVIIDQYFRVLLTIMSKGNKIVFPS